MRVEIYRFASRTERWLFTSADRDQIHLGETYTAVPIGREKNEMTENIHKASLTVSVPRDNALASRYFADRPESMVSLTIYEIGGPSPRTIWKGRIVSVNAAGARVKITLESIFTSLNRPGLRAVYQLSCRHPLYGTYCRVLSSQHQTLANITAISGVTLTVSGIGGFANGWFTSGYLVQEGIRYRMIMTHTGDQITIDRPLRHTGEIRIYPGCNHLMSDCKNKFANLLNFGGFPWIPGQTPFEGLGALGVAPRAL